MSVVPYSKRELVQQEEQTVIGPSVGRCPTCGQSLPFATNNQQNFQFNREYFESLGNSPAASPPPPAMLSAADGEETFFPRQETMEGDTFSGSNDDIASTRESVAKGYFERNFVDECQLGRGSFGSVHVCRHVVGGEILGVFAVKKIPVGNDARYLRKVLNEVRILEQLRRHPNVIEYNHSWLDRARTADFGPRVRCLFILMEYASLGSLDTYLNTCGKYLPDDAVWHFILSALNGLSFLHSRGILHRDIKPENFLLTASGHENGAPRLLISDFGTAAALLRGDAMIAETAFRPEERTGGTGTREYMAPELFISTTRPSSIAAPSATTTEEEIFLFPHSVQSDLYSLGMVIHFLAFEGTLPVETRTETGDLSRTIRSSACRHGRPKEMIELISALIAASPANRPASCQALLASPHTHKIRSRVLARPWSEIMAGCGEISLRPTHRQLPPLLLQRERSIIDSVTPARSPAVKTVRSLDAGMPSSLGDGTRQPWWKAEAHLPWWLVIAVVIATFAYWLGRL